MPFGISELVWHQFPAGGKALNCWLGFIHPLARSSAPSGGCAILTNCYLPRKDIEVAVRHGQPENAIHVVGDKEVFEVLDKLVAI